MVLIGLGSNQGDSVALVEAGVEALRDVAEGDLLCSSLWRTSPVNCPPGSPDFINAVVAFTPEAGLTPRSLLKRLKALERAFGRGRNLIRNAPRELDLDLLVFHEICMRDKDLEIPHPRAAERRFVLAPAAEVAPALAWPGTGKTVDQLLRAIKSEEVVTRLKGNPDQSYGV